MTKKNTDLEVLRGVAIVFTLVTHLGWDILLKAGKVGARIHEAFIFWTGVDLFFAISGYIITASLLRDPALVAAPGGMRRPFLGFAGPFWVRRVFRLLPSAWLWIGLTLVLAAGFNLGHSFGPWRDNLAEGGASLGNFANLYFYRWYAAGNFHHGTFMPYWSLSLEEQFYLVFPFLIYFLPRRALAVVLGAIAFAQLFLARPNGFIPGHPSLFWFVRTDALVLGVLIGLWQGHARYRRAEPRFLANRRVAVPVVALIILGLAAVPASLPVRSTGLVALISATLVFIASYDRNYLWPAGRGKDVMVWLGSRSYSIYLIHETMRALILEIKLRLGIPQGSLVAGLWTILSLVVIFSLSEVNYRLIETPGRRFGRKLAARLGARRKPAAVGLGAVDEASGRLSSSFD